jgi:penicillin-binding protein 2
MAYLMIEKYLTDSLRAERAQEVDRIASTNLMPGYLPRLQYKEDSARAYFYFNLTKDSNYIKKYLHKGYTPPPVKKEQDTPKTRVVYRKPELFEPEKGFLIRKKNATV